MTNEEIWQVVRNPKPMMSDQTSFSHEDMEIIAMLHQLRSAGVSDNDLYGLCTLLQERGNCKKKVCHLRKVRCDLLVRLHEQQQVLDALDNYVDALKKTCSPKQEVAK